MQSIQLGAATCAVAYIASLVVVHTDSSPAVLLLERGAYHLFFALVIVSFFLRARHSPGIGGAWLAMGFFVVFQQIGVLVHLFHLEHEFPALGVPLSSVSDLVSYVALVVGVAWLTQRSPYPRMLSVRLDGAVVGFAVGSVAASVRFQSIPPVTGDALNIVIAMSHPLVDLTLLMLVVAGLALQDYRPPWPMAVLILGVSALVAGDVIGMRSTATGSELGALLLSATVTLGFWMLGLSALAEPDRRRSSRAPNSNVPHRLLLLPIGSGLAALSVIVLSLLSHVPRIALGLATCSLLLVIARMTVTLREARQGYLNFRDARTDELTGLANRRGFLEAINSTLAVRPRTAPLAILLIDLNGFKEVNDSLGHLMGDELLAIVGRRFITALSGDATVARIGGDEFAVAFDVRCIDDAIRVAKELSETHAGEVSLDGVTVRVSASYGIALFPVHGTTALELMRSADVAMYAAKTSHRTICTYRADRDLNSRGRLALVGELRAAIESSDLILHYQPTRDFHTQGIRGVEALVRWQHPTRGILAPDDFIPMAERVGLVPSLSRVVMEKAITEAARLHVIHHELQMSVNISRFDLQDDALTNFIEQRLDEVDMPGTLLTLEITESSLGEDPERLRESIERLRSFGIRVSIDDFGVGYSAMSQLLSLPLDEIKIDKSFILALSTDRRAKAIISSAIELAQALDLTLVAEGIETAQNLRVLEDLGADIGQGFFIAHPLTSVQLDDFLALGWSGQTDDPTTQEQSKALHEARVESAATHPEIGLSHDLSRA